MTEIGPGDFAPVSYSPDSTAGAVILFNAGSAKYKTDGDAWFEVVYTYRKRVRLMSKNAFDLATVQIPLYHSSDKSDRLEDLQACTYNVENGKVIKTKLDKESLFKDKANDEVTIQKFTFPNLQEGCIIEYSYNVISPRPYYLRGWNFQDRYPVLHSEYEVKVPVLFDFIFLTNGTGIPEPFVDYTTENYTLVFRNNSFAGSTEVNTYRATNILTKWTAENLSPMKKENYTTTTSNYISKIEFQLKSINYPNADPQPFMNTWYQVDSLLRVDDRFGADLAQRNNDMEDDVKRLTGNNQLKTAENIYNFVKNNFACSDHDAVYLSESLRNVYRSRKGNVADVNMVLTSMLMKAGIEADPVLLSTRDNGFPYELYPLINKFNYVITKAVINGTEYLLDASQKRMGFNRLPLYCYNGSGRTINTQSYLVSVSADSLSEIKRTAVSIVNSPDNKSMKGSFSSDPGYYESYDLRNTIAELGLDDYLKQIKSSYGFDVAVTNGRIDSLSDDNKDAVIKYDLSFSFDEDLVYFNPMMTEGYRKNPFVAATRNYPVEMPYKTDETFTLSMEIPAGYVVEELPKSSKVVLNESDGKFEYIIRSDGKQITLTNRLQINRANFDAGEYSNLREFFTYIVKKQNESIVFKKVK